MNLDLELIEIDAAEVERYPDAIDRVLRQDIFGVLVRGVFAPEPLARMVEELERGTAIPMFYADNFRGRTYGRVLRMAGDCLDEYFEAARLMRPALRAAFGDGPGYEERLQQVLGTLGGGRPVCVPSVGARTYAPTTVRVLDPGGTVFLHCGNETHVFPALRELTQLIDPAGEISTLMPLALPESGGDLEVYDLCFGDPLITELDNQLGRENAHQALGDRLRVRLRPGVGDLALFAEGQHYHRVSEVRGSASRWTMGGFLAPSRDGRTLHYWS